MFAQRQIQSRRRSRSLRFERLESRWVMTGLDLPVDAGSLAEYLAQPPVMGPALEPVAIDEAPSASPVLDPEAIAEPLAASAVESTIEALAGEGEGDLPGLIQFPTLPTILTFTAQHVDGGWIRLSGSISATTFLTIVQFGGLFSGHMTTCDSSGNFTYFAPDPGSAGFVTAQVAGSSTILSSYLD